MEEVLRRTNYFFSYCVSMSVAGASIGLAVLEIHCNPPSLDDGHPHRKPSSSITYLFYEKVEQGSQGCSIVFKIISHKCLHKLLIILIF